MPKFKIGDKVYRSANPYETETVTRVTTDLHGDHWYYTITEAGVKRTFGLAEHEIRITSSN